MRTFTMITRHGVSKEKISAYTLISSDYQTVTLDTNTLIKNISGKQITVVNLAVEGGKIVSTNGAIDKYTFINTATNQVEGTARAVIIDRVEKGNKLIGYTVFTQNGTLIELNVADAVALTNGKLISNGKIRHTEQGDIVSAIGGNYPLREIALDKAPKGEISTSLMFFGTILGAQVEYFGAIVSCTSATEMSKLTDVLSKSNAKVISEAAKLGGNSVRESLSIKRFGTNGIYGVFETSMLDKLIKANSEISNLVGAVTVSAVKYNGKAADEATVKIDNNWKVIENNSDSSDIGKKVKSYTKKLIDKYNSVKISK